MPCVFKYLYISHIMRKNVSEILERQGLVSAGTATQSDQPLCCSFARKYEKTCCLHMRKQRRRSGAFYRAADQLL